MEIFELRYFACAARHENILRASEELRISAGSISKAIARLEDELGVLLFHRVGRNVKLTDHGRLLQRRAGQILALEEASRVELKGSAGELGVTLAGPEVFLAHFGFSVMAMVKKRHPKALFRLEATTSDEDAIRQVEQGAAHLAIVSTGVPDSLEGKEIAQTTFDTCVGKGHPLYRPARSGRSVPIETVLEHGFACPEPGILGQLGARQSSDGWRDDKFPRRIEFVTPSLHVLCNIVQAGLAVAYLPDVIARSMSLETIKVTGCPYSCTQKIRVVREATANTFDFIFARR